MDNNIEEDFYGDNIYLILSLISFLFMIISLELGFNRESREIKKTIYKTNAVLMFCISLFSVVGGIINKKISFFNDIRKRMTFISYFIYLYFIVLVALLSFV